jgi:hypothetical protein
VDADVVDACERLSLLLQPTSIPVSVASKPVVKIERISVSTWRWADGSQPLFA